MGTAVATPWQTEGEDVLLARCRPGLPGRGGVSLGMGMASARQREPQSGRDPPAPPLPPLAPTVPSSSGSAGGSTPRLAQFTPAWRRTGVKVPSFL